MKSKIIRLVSVVMALVITMQVSLCLDVSAKKKTCSCKNIPIVYIRGRSTIHMDKDAPSDENNPSLPDVSDAEIAKAVVKIMPKYLLGLLTNNYKKFAEAFVDVFEEIFYYYGLDENGEPRGNTGTFWNWKKLKLTDSHKNKFDYNDHESTRDYMYQYFYHYDCRIDPFVIAKDLHDYISEVKKVTGHNKIRLVARCMGGAIMTTYLYLYGAEDIESIVSYNSIVNGTITTDDLFRGKLKFDPDTAELFLKDYSTQEDDNGLRMIYKVISVMNKMNILDGLLNSFNKTAADIYPMTVPAMVRSSYGSMPAFWACIDPDCYDEAKKYVFGGVENEYKNLIKKIDKYHEKVGKHINEIYKKAEKQGARVCTVTKFGCQMIPISEESGNLQGDDIASLEGQSFGAYSAPVGERLTSIYYVKSMLTETKKYISPDKTVDASTALFPDTSWFVRDIAHNDYPSVMYSLVLRIARGDIKTVWDNKNFPQYMVYDKNNQTVLPMSVENNNIDNRLMK